MENVMDKNAPWNAVCRVCGCSWFDPCDPPCSWVEPDLCSACVDSISAPEEDAGSRPGQLLTAIESSERLVPVDMGTFLSMSLPEVETPSNE